MPVELTDPEDEKLLTLARSSRTRGNAREGAAVRDTDGRTYTATNVNLPSLQLSALQAATAMAISSGATELEVGLVVTDALSLNELDVSVIREYAGDGIVLYRVATDGSVLDSVTT